jgi:hypothetical protein
MNKEKNTEVSIPEEVIISKIYLIREKKVMLDRDLAELYGVETKRLKEQVRRNKDRFPDDFMFEMSKEELEDWRSQFATSNREVMGLRVPPFAFTEHGAVMLASVLNSNRAIQVNIQIVRIFTRLREVVLDNKEILLKLEQLERRTEKHNKDIEMIFTALRQLLDSEQSPREQIGFKTGKKSR